MADLNLRPLSLGEILDRTFSLYRRNFVLFLGINAIPQLLVLALNLTQSVVGSTSGVIGQPRAATVAALSSGGLSGLGLLGIIVGWIVYMVAYLFAQGGSVFAVSEIYLGRTTTIGASLSRMRGQLGSLFGVLLLNGLAIGGGLILLIIPGIYFACRLCTCVPAALLEDLGPQSSLSRSYALTKDNAGRAFVIFLLYIILLYAALFLFAFPFALLMGLAAKDPSMMRVWLSVTQIGNFMAGVLVSPFITIATAVFYYDLRVRKEAFDLQFMINPTGNLPSGNAGVPTILS
jgi:hypothetical protein